MNSLESYSYVIKLKAHKSRKCESLVSKCVHYKGAHWSGYWPLGRVWHLKYKIYIIWYDAVGPNKASQS